MEKKENELRKPSWEHVYIYNRLKEKAKGMPYIRPKALLEVLKQVLRVPKTLHYPILKQMEEEGLIKRVNHQKYEIFYEHNNKYVDDYNQKLKDMQDVYKRDRMLKSMEEMGLIKKDKGSKYYILESEADQKLELIGNYTFW